MKLSSIFLRAALALALAGGTGLACAGPQYHVSVDTQSLSGQSGYLDFLFLGLGNAAAATATLSNFSGDFGADAFTAGAADGGTDSEVTLGNGSSWNEFGQWAHFGGLFGFDLAFEVAPGSAGHDAGTTLSVTLLDADFGYLPAAAGDIATFALLPGQEPGIAADAGFATVNAVPEPSSAWLGAAGLLLMGATRRRRRP